MILTAEWVPIASLIISCLGIPALGALVITDLYKHFKSNTEAAKEKKNEELKKAVREVVSEEMRPMKEDVNDLKISSELTKQGLQATLRHELYAIADKWLAKGYCPSQDKEDFENIYKKYHALGKNGVMDDIYFKIMELPVSKPRSKTTTKHKHG